MNEEMGEKLWGNMRDKVMSAQRIRKRDKWGGLRGVLLVIEDREKVPV